MTEFSLSRVEALEFLLVNNIIWLIVIPKVSLKTSAKVLVKTKKSFNVWHFSWLLTVSRLLFKHIRINWEKEALVTFYFFSLLKQKRSKIKILDSEARFSLWLNMKYRSFCEIIC